MERYIKDRIEASRWILNNGHGLLKDVPISRELFSAFCTIGYIKIGMRGTLEECWTITEFGIRQLKAYLSLSDMKEELDSILIDLNKIKI